MAGRILVLDDEENYAAMLQELLREHNYRVDMATRSERAIALLEEVPYDLVISDYKMPVMDGADFLKRARELYPNLPFILVSGLMNTPELVKVANMNVTLVMEKPLDTESFLYHVERFSLPMTEEEKAVYSQQIEGGAVSKTIAAGLPDKPRFVSAESPSATGFMLDLWLLANQENYCFLYEQGGGELSLALKDISAWLGNHDKPLVSFDLKEAKSDGISKLQSIAVDPESSSVVVIRIEDLEDFDAAKRLAMTSKELAPELFLSFVCSSSSGSLSFKDFPSKNSCEIPLLSQRPKDVANYIQRFLRIASERYNKPKLMELSPEIVYALLAHEWSSYRSLQETMTHFFNECRGATLEEAVVLESLKTFKASSSELRMKALLVQSQALYLKNKYASSGLSMEAFSASYELPSSVQSESDFTELPLLDSNLAS
ncbi:MAG: response regulator [Opitutaceae bacterium]